MKIRFANFLKRTMQITLIYLCPIIYFNLSSCSILFAEADLGGGPFLGKNLVAYIGNHWGVTGAGPLLGESVGPHLWKFLDPPLGLQCNEKFSHPEALLISIVCMQHFMKNIQNKNVSQVNRCHIRTIIFYV